MRACLTLCGFVFLHGVCLAADVKVAGRVVDASSGAGVAGATVEFKGLVMGKQPEHHPGVNETVRVDAEGRFTVEYPEGMRLTVNPKAAGYAPLVQYDSLEIERGSGPITFTIRMSRSAGIAGRVVDADTDLPVAGMGVTIRRLTYFHGHRELTFSTGNATTGKDGAFLMENIAPGNYVVVFNHKTYDETDPTVRPVERYPRLFWPGPGDQDSASPIAVGSGVTLSIGDIRLRRTSLPQLTVKVVGGDCTPGKFYQVELTEQPGHSVTVYARLRAECGGVARLAHANTGKFVVLAETGGQELMFAGEKGVVNLQMGDRDMEVVIPVTSPLAVRGKVTSESGVALPAEMSVKLWARGSDSTAIISPIRSFASGKIGSDGDFESNAYIPPGGEILASVSGLPGNFYIKEIRYNGITSSGASFIVNPNAARHNLEIVCSDRAASISGSVRTADGQAVAKSAVLLTRWPTAVVETYPAELMERTGDAAGSFAFRQLRPGTYRAIAVEAGSRDPLEEPGKLMAAFGSAEALEVSEAGGITVNLVPYLPR